MLSNPCFCFCFFPATLHISFPLPLRSDSDWPRDVGQDNLHSGPVSPVSLSASDITTLLPCDEESFANGKIPSSRAALEDTPPAIENPDLLIDPNRSLFASLIQIHYYWGSIARRAMERKRHLPRYRDPGSEFGRWVEKLRSWEENLPKDHTWSPVMLRGYKTERQNLVSRFYGTQPTALVGAPCSLTNCRRISA